MKQNDLKEEGLKELENEYGNAYPISKSFSITREESEQLEKEYEINDILYYLYKAAGKVGYNATITEAIEIIRKQTRFADEVETNFVSMSALVSSYTFQKLFK